MYDKNKRCQKETVPRYGVIEALYMIKRRLIMIAVATMMIAELCSAISCATETCAAPANMAKVMKIALTGDTPAAMVTTPVSIPNGMIPGITGIIVLAPAMNDLWTDNVSDIALDYGAGTCLSIVF